MRLTAALFVATVAAAGSAHASSIVVLDSDAMSPSSIFVGLSEPVATSFVMLGTMPIDTGSVAAVAPQPHGNRLGPEVMVIRGGEIGSASPEPSSIAPATPDAAPAQQAEAGSEAPVPATEPAAALPETE